MTEQDILIMNSDSTHVDVELSFDNGINTIKNNKIYSESMSLIDSISDSESIVFGKCNISQFQVKVADFEGNIDGALMNVLLKFSNAELGTCEYNLGQYIVSDSERTSDKMFRVITAYDKMSLFNVDIANWYNYTLFPFEVIDNNLGWLPVNENGVVIDLTYSIAGEPQTSLDKNDDGAYYLNTNDGIVYVGYATYDESGEFASVEWKTYLQCEKNESYTESCNVTRTVNEILAMLCEYVGVTYNTDFVLINGGVVVKRDFNPQSLNGLDFLQQICELNGVFGHINNNGILDFIAPDKSTKKTIDVFKKCDYSEYTVQPINSVSIKYDSNDMGTAVTRSGIEKLNQYEIVGNIFLQSVKTEDELKTIAGNILSVIENVSYVPCSVEVKCGLNLELGDYITVNAKTIKEESVSSVSFDTLVLCRNISGIQSIYNRIEANGTEYVNKNAESLASQLQITNKTIDKLYKEYTANTANFMYLYSKAITTDSLTANVANIGTLNANSAFVKFLQTNVVDANYIRAVTAEIGYLTANSAVIVNLETNKLNTSDLNAENAKLGFLTATSAIITSLQTDKLDTDSLSAEVAKLGYLTADSAVITSLQTDKLDTKSLSAEVAKLGYLDASSAVITSLQTGKLDTSQLSAEVAKLGYLDAKMANIDFANLNKANIGQLFADVGLISSATITDGHVTGYLDSVEVNANKITAGTLAVDRLLIKDSSGNYKMATYDSSGNLVTTTVNGSVITNRTITSDHLVAGTITANEINMTNLVGNSAFINAINTNSIVVSASNNASSALSTANTANTKAQGIIDNIYTPKTTTINGGKITTGSIKAAQIDVNNLFAQNITATGTITGATLKGAHVEATSGFIGNWNIVDGSIVNEVTEDNVTRKTEFTANSRLRFSTINYTDNPATTISGDNIICASSVAESTIRPNEIKVCGTAIVNKPYSSITPTTIYENGTALSNKYAPISHSHNDYLPLSGGTVNGAITFGKSDDYGIRTNTNNYGRIGDSTNQFYEVYSMRYYEDKVLLKDKYLGINANAVSATALSSEIANDKLPYRLQTYHTSNVADTTACGFNYVSSGNPFGTGSDFMTISQGYDSTWGSQIATDFRSNNIAVRCKNSGTWSDWATVITDKTIGSQSVNYATSSYVSSRIYDSQSGAQINITYAKAGQSSTSWLASWNGYELGAISPSVLSVNYANSAGSATNATNDGNGNNIVNTYETIANTSGLFQKVVYSYSSVTISASGTTTVSPSSRNIPNGYNPVAIISVNTGSNDVLPRSFHGVDGKMRLRNVSSSSATITPGMEVLCVKSSYVG